MRHVVIADEQARRHPEYRLDFGAKAGLCTQHPATGGDELITPSRRNRQSVVNHAIERQDRVVVKYDRIEFRWVDEGFAEAVINRLPRKARIVFSSAKIVLPAPLR